MARHRGNPLQAAIKYRNLKARQAESLKQNRRDNAFIGKVIPQPPETEQRFLDALTSRRVDKDRTFDYPDYIGQSAAIKDNFRTRGLPTTCASNILCDFRASPATVITTLEDAGVSVVAKTNMDEFGMGSNSVNSAFGPVRSGRGTTTELSAGGSSGGSAVAVAQNLVDFALGSDTGGSVRLPAAYSQVFGFKPSYGRISRHGLIPYANSLDTVGIMTRSPASLRSIFELLDHPDPKDPTCLTLQTRQRIEKIVEQHNFRTYDPLEIKDNTTGKPFRKCRIGVPVEYNIAELHPLVRQAWLYALARLEAIGHTTVPITLPSTQEALSAYYILAPAEASSNLAKYDGVRYGTTRPDDSNDDDGGTLYASYRGALFGNEVQHRILLGSYTLSAGAIDNYFIQAQKVRRLVQQDFNMVFRMSHPLIANAKDNVEGVDFVVCPTAPAPPPLIADLQQADPLEGYTTDVFTVPASLAGLPALSVPAPTTHGGSANLDQAIGIQIIGQYGNDSGVISFARWFEAEYITPGRGRRPGASNGGLSTRQRLY